MKSGGKPGSRSPQLGTVKTRLSNLKFYIIKPMYQPKQLRGVFPILNSTFDEDGGLDLESQANLVRHLLRQGAHGLGLFGNASEGYALSDAERTTLLRLVRETAGPGVPLIASTGHSGTQLAAELGRKAQDLGADALMVLPPSYMK